MKKKRFSPLKFLVTVICLVAIASSVIINVSFAKSEVPKFYDRYVYVVGESNPLEGDITTGAALIAKDASDISIASGDIVLCYPSDNPSVISLRSINAVVEGDDGSESYYTRDNFHEDNTESIPKQSIVAVCTGYPESLELGRFIVFTRDMKGIIAEFIAPCILLVILLIAGIISSKGSDDDDENILYEYDEEEKEQSQQQARKNAHVKQSNTPLYDPASDIRPSEELNKKQMSIAENFSQKKVDHDSPYQKEKERTMQYGNLPKISQRNPKTETKSKIKRIIYSRILLLLLQIQCKTRKMLPILQVLFPNLRLRKCQGKQSQDLLQSQLNI